MKNNYNTKLGAVWNLISNRNYTDSIFYKILYIIYFISLFELNFERSFGKSHAIFAIFITFIIIFNGRKFDDRDKQILEYLPISYKDKVKYVQYTTYIGIIIAGFLCGFFEFWYNNTSIIEYTYLIPIALIISTFTITQIILTKKSLVYFFLYDIIIGIFVTIIMNLILTNSFAIKFFDNTQFNISKVLCIIIMIFIYHYLNTIMLRYFEKGHNIKGIKYLVVVLFIIASVVKIHSMVNESYDRLNDNYKQANTQNND